jgi:hypothetical protein
MRWAKAAAWGGIIAAIAAVVSIVLQIYLK